MWKKVVLRVVLGLIALIIILIIGTLLYIRHNIQYYDGERLDEAALNAQADKYMEILQELQSRPKNDRLALSEMLVQIEPYILCKEMFFVRCGDDVVEQLMLQQETIDEIIHYDDIYRSIVSDGYVLQYDVTDDVEMHTSMNYRALICMQMKAAVLEVLRSQPHAAAERIILNLQVIDGLYKTPDVLPNILALASEISLHSTLVSILPHLSSDDIHRIEQALRNTTTVKQSILETIMSTCAVSLLTIDKPLVSDEWDMDLREWGRSRRIISNFLWQTMGFKRWERLRYIKANTEVYLYYKKRIDQDMQQEASGGAEVQKKMASDPILAYLSPIIQLPWTSYDSMMSRAWSNDRFRESLISAMSAELRRRETGSDQTITLPYGDEGRIVLGPEHGCIDWAATFNLN